MDSETLRKEAKRTYKGKNFREAAALYAKLVETPGDATPEVQASDRSGYASVLASLNQLGEAAAQLEAVIALTPDDARAQLKLGEVLSRLGRHGEAVERFAAAVRLEPGVADTHWRLAMELRVLGRDEESRQALQQCLEINPDHTEAQLLQMEGALTQSPERDGQFEDFNFTTANGYSGQLLPIRREIRHTPLLIFLEALGLVLASLWVRSLFA